MGVIRSASGWRDCATGRPGPISACVSITSGRAIPVTARASAVASVNYESPVAPSIAFALDAEGIR